MATSFQEITDSNGRVFRVGESPQDIMGRSRAWMVFLPWIAMMAVSVFEYGWGAAEETLEEVHGWSLNDAFWLASVWAVFQAGVAFPAGRLREKGIVSAKAAMLTAAVCSGIGYFTIAHSGNLVLAFIGYSVLGGTGAGLVYATCINMVGKWYPDKRGARTGFVNGGFAYGTIPFIFVFSYVFEPGNFTLVLDLVGLYMLVVVGFCGFLFKDPPKNWWPAEVDPLTFSKGKKGKDGKSVTLSKNPPAVRQFTPKEAFRTGMLPLMWGCLVIIGGVSLFGITLGASATRLSGMRQLAQPQSEADQDHPVHEGEDADDGRDRDGAGQRPGQHQEDLHLTQLHPAMISHAYRWCTGFAVDHPPRLEQAVDHQRDKESRCGSRPTWASAPTVTSPRPTGCPLSWRCPRSRPASHTGYPSSSPTARRS
ncbi:OFA family MFS transporter [Kibdelosporangium lantanae]|uniref:OFA family MFS transporter n=1 Tax=Kibdelosporangium lantanae TaxID=1497396 RepID=A0ABW3M6H1_9PSEU